MKPKLLTAILLMSLSVLSSQLSNAQESNTEGIFLAAHLDGSAWTLDDFDVETEAGGGFGLGIGYGFNNLVAAFLNVDAALMEDSFGDPYSLAHADLGVRFSFRGPQASFRPNVVVGLNGRAATFESEFGDIEVSGAGFTAGIGAQYFISRSVAIDGALIWTFGELSEIKVDGLSEDISLDATSARFNVGVNWYVGR